MSNGNVMIIHLIVGLMKKISLHKKESFSTLRLCKSKIQIKLDLSNFETKSDVKNATEVVPSQFSKIMIELT